MDSLAIITAIKNYLAADPVIAALVPYYYLRLQGPRDLFPYIAVAGIKFSQQPFTLGKTGYDLYTCEIMIEAATRHMDTAMGEDQIYQLHDEILRVCNCTRFNNTFWRAAITNSAVPIYTDNPNVLTAHIMITGEYRYQRNCDCS